MFEGYFYGNIAILDETVKKLAWGSKHITVIKLINILLEVKENGFEKSDDNKSDGGAAPLPNLDVPAPAYSERKPQLDKTVD